MKGPRDSLWRVLAWSVAAIGLIWGFVQSQTKTVRIVIETESGSIEAEERSGSRASNGCKLPQIC